MRSAAQFISGQSLTEFAECVTHGNTGQTWVKELVVSLKGSIRMREREGGEREMGRERGREREGARERERDKRLRETDKHIQQD